jgi:lysophospholipase L1-like esterase
VSARARLGAASQRLLGALLVASVVAGCTAGPGATTSPSAIATETSPILTDAALPTPSEEESAAPQVRYVALGDSIAAATICQCPRYPEVFGQLAAEALGQPVRTQNLAVNRTTSRGLLDVLDSPAYKPAVEDADIITITIGINDINPCGDESDRACYESGIAEAASNLEAILDQIDTLQGDRPHMLRVTAYYNFEIGKPAVVELGPSYQAFYAEQLAALNAAICASVTEHGGVCVELPPAFNGPAGDQDAGALLVGDHEHPSREGHRVIAEAIAAAGYAPLGE